MAASVEDQITTTTTTHVEDEDHQMVDAPVEDHMVDDAPVEDQPADPPVEDHLAAPADDPPAEDSTVPDPPESHPAVVVMSDPAGDPHMIVTPARVEEEDHLVTVAHVEGHVLVDQMEAIHVVGDQMEPLHPETQMVVTGDELAIMSQHHHDEQLQQQMSAFDEEKMLITPYEDKMLTPYEAKTPGSYENNNNNNSSEVANPETQPSKRRKKKSIVWEHFTIETVSAGCRRACCKQCKQTFAYSTGSKVAGTSHLKRHIAKGTCQDKSLSPYTPASRGGGGSNSAGTDQPRRRYRTSAAAAPQVLFDADRCRHEIARMIIMHDYPLHLVEHPGFLTFVQNLQPQFQMVSFNAVQGDCVATYLTEKQHLIKFIEGIPGRVCLTLDMWNSSQSVGYVFVTGHFIDGDWKLQKRLLNVVMEPYPDSDAALSHAVAVCLHDWNLENRLFSLTLNQPLRQAAIDNLRPLLTVKNPTVLEGQLILGSCLARTFSSIACAVITEGREVVEKVRESVKHVKTSDSHEEKFLELKQQLQVPSEKTLSIDDHTQWNTTYQMLTTASELKEVFSCLDTSDQDYKGAPTGEDWKQVETLCAYLRLLFDSISILATTMNPTPIAFFHEVWKIQSELARAVATEDPFTGSVTRKMQEKIDLYWKECSLALAAAVVMDPRFKMKLVEFSFNKIYGEEAPARIKAVDEGIHELFDEYVALPLPLTPTYAEDGSHAGNVKSEEHQGGGGLLSDNGLTDFDVYIMETTSQQMKSELDQYLDESLLPRVHEFDVLGWWKLNKLKYPTLSKVARDILSVPVSVAPPDSIFSTTEKEMDTYRSSLRPETVEALICAKDWMQHGASEASNALVRMEY